MRPQSRLTRCRQCGVFVDPSFAMDSPQMHLNAIGTEADPRAPGDRRDICRICDYGTGH